MGPDRSPKNGSAFGTEGGRLRDPGATHADEEKTRDVPALPKQRGVPAREEVHVRAHRIRPGKGGAGLRRPGEDRDLPEVGDREVRLRQILSPCSWDGADRQTETARGNLQDVRSDKAERQR